MTTHSLSLARAFLSKHVNLVIDRPLGSVHPKHGFTYPINYGYVPQVLAPDGEELDAYVLGSTEPLETFEGVCIAVIHRHDDDDDKLVVVPEGRNFSDDEIYEAVAFQEKWFSSSVIRTKESCSHEMRLKSEPFSLIEHGSKTVEIRLNDEKRQQIAIGDVITFTHSDDPVRSVVVEVTGLKHFSTFEELFRTYPLQQLGASGLDEYELMYQYYSKEEEAKWGVLGIEFSLKQTT